MKRELLSKSEYEIMDLLWRVDRALTASEIVELSTEKSWKDSYIHLLVNSLLDNGMIRPESFVKTAKNYARTFVPTITRIDYMVLLMTQRGDLDTAMIVAVVAELIKKSEEPAVLVEELEKMLAEQKGSLQ